jgi:hypothetical protein
MPAAPQRTAPAVRYHPDRTKLHDFAGEHSTMSHRSIFIPMIAALAAIAVPAAAFAAGNSPFTIGVGKFIPTSPSSSVEGFAPFPGTNVQQNGNISFELTFGHNVIPGGYQITAMLLSQHQTGTYASILGPISANETVTQVPVMFEGGGTQFGPLRFGGGLGYDFASTSTFNGAPRTSGIVGDTFVELGVGSGASLEAKYIFGQRAALGGVYVGIKTQL